mmetsp:Transcript_118378/g.232445  ORF Transcript_118378/g.232445 Transcript_118378/m.232445 type:complete len:610 (+) Transcript_118378:1-1830(+)
MLLPALKALPSPCNSLAPQVLRLLQGVWRHNSEMRCDVTDVPMLSNALPWETEAFDLALFVLTEASTGYGWDVRIEAASALHFCLLKRTRRSCHELMMPSLIEKFSEKLLQIATMDPSSHSHTPTVRGQTEAQALATLRLACCKVVDAWDACRSERSNTSASVTSGTQQEEESNESVHEQERRELEEDALLLQEVAGIVCFNELRRRFLVTEEDVQQEAQSSCDLNGDDVDDGEDDPASAPTSPHPNESVATSVEAMAGMAMNDGSSSSIIYSTVQSKRVSKRSALRVMVRRDPLGSTLLWALLLQRIDTNSVQGWQVRARCVNYLKKSGIASNALFCMLRIAGDLLQFKDVSALLQRISNLTSTAVHTSRGTAPRPKRQSDNAQSAAHSSIVDGNLQHLAVYAVFRTVCTLPAMFRSFWSDDCNRIQKTQLSSFVEERVRVSLIKREIAMISLSAAAGRWDSSEFTVKGSTVSGEVSAVLSRDETTVEIKVKLPPSYPLKNVEVNCTSRIGVADGRWRRWVLQIIQLMSMQDGSVVDAVLLWKCNIEKELEGVEPCPICYCTLHTKTLCLPTMTCMTCNNKFHSPCLTTWFRSSGKSKCVICQQPFYP